MKVQTIQGNTSQFKWNREVLQWYVSWMPTHIWVLYKFFNCADNWNWSNTTVGFVIISFLKRNVASSLFSVIIELKWILESKTFSGSQALCSGWDWRMKIVHMLMGQCSSNLTSIQTYSVCVSEKDTQAHCSPNRELTCKDFQRAHNVLTRVHTLWKIQSWILQKGMFYCQRETSLDMVKRQKKPSMQTHSSASVSKSNSQLEQ